jgi:two-component system response regulator HydG
MESNVGRILAVDDNEDILFALELLLKSHFELVTTLNSPDKIPELLTKEYYDVILLDMNFTKENINGKEGFDWLKKILEIDSDAVVLFITAYGDAEDAVKAIKSGATDFILKPWQNEKLLATVSASVKLRRSRIEADELRKRQKEICSAFDQPYHEFIGNSSEIKEVFSIIKKVANTDANILILGENGTGKELVARAIHRNSLRKDEVFISVDLGSITNTLFESELFGHEKGAFTDAKREKPGRFEIASKGTLFLDEIGNLSLPLQTKILTAIEKKEVTRVGANKPVSVDVRLICATNNDLYKMTANNEFRQDLLYRVNTVEINIPPLRERTEDIELIANHFLKIYSKKYKKSVNRISSAAIKKLNHYPWSGNVRELQHAIERAVIMTDQNSLDPEDFILTSQVKKTSNNEFDTYNLEDIEKRIIIKVLKQNQGNITQASKVLGLTRTSLYRRMEKYKI